MVKNHKGILSMTEKVKKFKFSIVSAIYNVEKYLKEMIESLVKQDIGFEDNVQLILVDDCSTDNSLEICKKYKQKYPENIIVCKMKSNTGHASKPRNFGLKFCTGEYINFMDSDDLISPNTLSAVYDFFSKNKNCNVVTIPVKLFGAINQDYWQNSKFGKESRLVDLSKEFNLTNMSVAYSFINSRCKDLIVFNENMAHGEDIEVINKVMLENRLLGLVPNCWYYYRKYDNSTSLSGSANKKLAYYTTDFDVLAVQLRQYAIDKTNEYPKFLQYVIASDLRWYLSKNSNISNLLSQDEITNFYNKIFDFFTFIDDDVIMALSNYDSILKNALLKHKYKKLYGEDKYLTTYLARLRHKQDKTNCIIDSFSNDKDFSYIDCHINVNEYSKRQNFEFYLNDEKIKDVKFNYTKTNKVLDMLESYESVYFSIKFKHSSSKKNLFKAVLKIDDSSVPVKLCATKNSPFNNEIPNTFYISNGWVSRIKFNKIFITKQHFGERLLREIKYDFSILKSKEKIKKFKLLMVRWAYLLLYPFMKNKNIWLFADKADKADDNAEVLFRYAQQHKQKNQKNYYLINKKFPDYKRMKQYGKVVDYMSIKHRLLFMFSNFNISAYSHSEFRNPFGFYEKYLRDISANSKFVFLQHGVTIGDVSNILKKSTINAKLFITASNGEYKSVRDKSYEYKPNEVALTGFARYDNLYDAREKIITVAPTWRKTLFSGIDHKTSRMELKHDFEKSEYYKNFTGLLNSKKLLSTAKKYGYTIQFLPHPILFPYVDKFKINKQVKIFDYSNTTYREIFAKSALMITDYSSLVFDFAYLKKPVVYYQFDMFTGGYNYNTGYFNFERDGFGEVIYTHWQLVDLVCEYIKNDCKIKDKYLQRINKTFAYTDKDNCKRIINKIEEINTRKPKPNRIKQFFKSLKQNGFKITMKKVFRVMFKK